MEEKRKLLEMRKGQAAALQAMINDLAKDGAKLKADNEVLLRHKAKLESDEDTLEIRLKSILKEKELLFSRLMDVENAVSQLQK